ncbi:MAG: 16S rRNA (guanine(966)-N(2))-methyltransferase RsmD [Steroidobacteraceae bacterium]|nr:16S rRNA (guanine(966)-N(2))-methyltransferase RsmD [Steroidobacteraceae bacterium]
MTSNSRRAARQLRIIGGAWRGRKFRFPPQQSIRPTPDRVRETLFNWLMGRVDGARVLDLYAGSGALGLEALSRGAAGAIFVERDAASVRALADVLAQFGAPPAEVVHADALQFLRGPVRARDLVFLDPPFGTDPAPVFAALAARGWLAPAALVYLELPARAGPPALPAPWQVIRSGRAGDVGYHLLRNGEGGAAAQ